MVMVRVGRVRMGVCQRFVVMRMGMGRARRLGWLMRVRVMGVVPVRVRMSQRRMDMLV